MSLLGAVTGAAGLLGGIISHPHPHTDAEYAARAAQLRAWAQAGNIEAAQMLHWGISRDHQIYGWGQYAPEWNKIASLPIANAALQAGDVQDDWGSHSSPDWPGSGGLASSPAGSATSGIAGVIERFDAAQQAAAATAAQELLAGASNAATGALAPQNGQITIPTSRSTLTLVALVVGVLVVLAVVLSRR